MGDDRKDSEAGAEYQRLEQDARREANWKRWGPYLAERQWGTVREDYSPDGNVWEYFSHDHARSRAYRWGEDGLLGLCDRECRLCFSLALWNGKDPILKERLFGLCGPEGNHGEDVKEHYFYLDATPTYSYLKALYKYPQAAFPYAQLVSENSRRGKGDPEFELTNTGVFDEGRYFDVFAEYAKAGPNDVLIRVTVHNRGPEEAPLHLLPTLWFRNTWTWGCTHEGCGPKGSIQREEGDVPLLLRAEHPTLGVFHLSAEGIKGAPVPGVLFTENETNVARLYHAENATPYVKDAFHSHVVEGNEAAVNPEGHGTKAAFCYRMNVPPGEAVVVRLRLFHDAEAPVGELFGGAYDEVFTRRIAEADGFYAARRPEETMYGGPENADCAARVVRQAYAGLLQSKQFYHYSVPHWLDGDPGMPPSSPKRKTGRNREWRHLFNRDILSMPDKWEYPWYAAWDLAFHMIPMARVDPDFAKEQLVLLLREWYMHPNGQIPAYEFAFGDVNPPVHAWACWRVYTMTGKSDRQFLARVFQKLLLNFTWWVNRKDVEGRNVFGGGFLGMDNIGVFDRSQPLGPGERLDQADGTAWMAFYCVIMLRMALELASGDPAYEDVASKFFEHYVAIVDAMGEFGEGGLWHEGDGFYYDQYHAAGKGMPVRLRSLVGVVPLLAVEVLRQDVLDGLPGFTKRMNWFLENRSDLGGPTSYSKEGGSARDGTPLRLLAVPSEERLRRVLGYVLDEQELLSPYGVRSLSRVYQDQPYRLEGFKSGGEVRYIPGESDTDVFGGNSNWRGPIWFPLNFLLIEALARYHRFYGDRFTIECPAGSGEQKTLLEVADELARRLVRLFLPRTDGLAPWQGGDPRWKDDPHFRDLVLFYEHFHGDNGRGLGASHQTGWTALVAQLLENDRPDRPAR